MCYPYMRESASTVDFEIRTDSLTSRIGLACAFTKDVPVVHKDLMYLLDMGYNLNGSVRGRLGITQEDLDHLSSMYDFYSIEVKDAISTFVLPQGTPGACILHTCRSEAKKSVRALHKVSLEREVPKILFDYTHLLANVLFVMAVYVNKQLGVDEIPHESICYDIKSTKK
ncbi:MULTISPECIES: hypothetical protein [Bacillaceae]|nr:MULTISPECIES: hypothetical protein [Bacillaceae]